MSPLSTQISYAYIKRTIALFIVFSYFIWGSSNIKAQEASFYFKHYTNENGLSQNSGKAIVQDSTGFIWIGTEDGLNRFDGYEFIQFRKSDKLKNNLASDYITSLYVDNKNHLWIGTWGGLNCYEQETEIFHTFLHHADNPSSIVSNTVKAVFIDSDNYLWVGTDKGLNRSKKSLEEIIAYDSIDFLLFSAQAKQNALTDNIIKEIKEDKNKNIWIASNKGLSKIDKKTAEVSNYLLPDFTTGNKIYDISIDKQGNIWLATNKSLFRFDIAQEEFFNYANNDFFKENKACNQILSLLADGMGGLYIGTKNMGLVYYNIDKKTYSHFFKERDKAYSLQNRQVSGLIIDKSNNLFIIGLNGLSVAEIKNKPFALNKCMRIKNNNLLSPNILSVYCSGKENLWLGFEQQGLALYNRKTKKFKNFLFEKLNNGQQISVKCILPASKNKLLIGSRENGLLLFDIRTAKYKQYKHEDGCGISSNNIFFITKDKNNSYWIATQGGGLNKFDLAKGSFKNYLPNEKDKDAIGHAIVTHVFIDSKENIWVATFGGGLNLLDEKTGKFTKYTNNINIDESISSNKVTHIFEDSSNQLWIGTAAGLNKFDPKNGSFIRYKSKDGLSNEFVYAIQEDNNSNLWISTNYGIFKFNKTTETFTNYDVKSGLQNNEFNINASCKTADSLLLFGGISGFNLFNPADIKNSEFEPKIAITDFKMFYKNIKIGEKYNKEVVLTKSINDSDTIYLNHKNNQFSFEFTAFDYTKPSAIKYSVRLKGFNDLWHKVSATKRYVSYTNLNPDTYTLQIRVSNADGVWSTNIKELVIIIKKPFYQKWWFILVSMITLLFIFFAIQYMRTLYLIKKKKELEKEVKERTKTIKQKNVLLTSQKEELKLQAEELRSITDQLKELNNNLEKKIVSRTTDLNSALEKAEDAQKLISSFLANMSHELRTPMNAISGFSQLISHAGTGDTERQKYSDIISQNIETLLSLVENIMDVAKLHTGQYKLVNSTFYLHDLCNEVYHELKNSLLDNKNIDFVFFPDMMPRIKLNSDPKAFRHIIYNVLDNALKYTEKGKVEFSCSCSTEIDKNLVYGANAKSTETVLNILISDTGIGIKKEYQETIFNAFRKVEHHKNKLFRGTGLGLSLVKTLTEKLFGKIKLESEPNKGTKVSISIPLSPIDNFQSTTFE